MYSAQQPNEVRNKENKRKGRLHVTCHSHACHLGATTTTRDGRMSWTNLAWNEASVPAGRCSYASHGLEARRRRDHAAQNGPSARRSFSRCSRALRPLSPLSFLSGDHIFISSARCSLSLKPSSTIPRR